MAHRRSGLLWRTTGRGWRPRFFPPLPALLLLLALAACQQQSGNQQAAAPPPSPVTVAKPVVKDVIERDEFTGRFDAERSLVEFLNDQGLLPTKDASGKEIKGDTTTLEDFSVLAKLKEQDEA